MRNFDLYRLPIAYSLVYVVLILLTGMWLFLHGQGMQGGDMVHIVKQIIQKPQMKSLEGFIEVASPHLFAMGVTVFTIAHFMLFSTRISEKISLIIFVGLFVFMLLDIFAYGLIMTGFVVSGWVKLFALLGFAVALSLMLFLVFFSLFPKNS